MRKINFRVGDSEEVTTLQAGDRILFHFADWVIFVQAWRGDTRLHPFSDAGTPVGDESWSFHTGPQPVPPPSKIPVNWRELFKKEAEKVAGQIALGAEYKLSDTEPVKDFDFGFALF